MENPVHPSYFTDEDTRPKEPACSLMEVPHLLDKWTPGLRTPGSLFSLPHQEGRASLIHSV